MISPLLMLDGAVLAALFGLSAFFSGSETALFALTPVQAQRIRDRNPRAGARLQRLLSQPERVLSTILIGNTIVNVAIASVSFVVVHMLAPQHSTIIAIPATTVLLLLAGDVVPKRIAIAHAEWLAPLFSAVLVLWMHVFAPLGRLLEVCSGLLRRFLLPERKALNDAELLTMMLVGAEQGVLDAGQLAEEPCAARHHEDVVGQVTCAGHHTPATVGDLLHRALVPCDAMPGKKPSQWHMEVRLRAQARRNPDQAWQVGQRIMRRDHHDLGIDALPPQLANGREAREAAADNGDPGHDGVPADMARKVSHIPICVNKKLKSGKISPLRPPAPPHR